MGTPLHTTIHHHIDTVTHSIHHLAQLIESGARTIELAAAVVDLEPRNFHIPFLIFAPQHIIPQRINTLNSQIDVGPTVLAAMGIGYESFFLGQNILTEGQHHERAFLANYLTVGYLEKGKLVQLMPNKRKNVIDLGSLKELDPEAAEVKDLIREAISHYQFTAKWTEIRPRTKP